MPVSDAVKRYEAEHGRKGVYCGVGKFLRDCKLCGNRWPLCDEHFKPTTVPDKRGLIVSGLLLVCSECREHWGPELRDDVKRLMAEADAGAKSITPLARRGKS